MKIPRFVLLVVCLVGGGAVAWATRAAVESPIPEKIVVTPNRAVSTEQEWIVRDVIGGIAGIARNGESVDVTVKRVADVNGHSAFDIVVGGKRQQIIVASHIWSPDTYATFAKDALGDAPVGQGDEDLNARTPLTDLRAEVLLVENRRISDALQANMRSATAHESAALLVGVLALREPPNMFGDVRPSLARMAAHLSVAQALRGSSTMSRDGKLARIVLTDLAGLQRQSLAMLDGFDHAAQPTAADRAWDRALRLRISGDWRQFNAAEEHTLLEKFEYARALRRRIGVDAFLDYLDTLDVRTRALPDWHRIAGDYLSLNVEAGHSLTNTSVTEDGLEATDAWLALHQGKIEAESLLRALNERPAAAPFTKIGNTLRVDVLDWGTWAAFSQRQMSASIAMMLLHLRNLGADEDADDLVTKMDKSFGQLTLFPVVEAWFARNADQYEDALARARPIAQSHPEVLTAAEWNALLKRPTFVHRTAAFPVNVGWFDPAVPEGTAFDLEDRSEQPGCPRPPTLEQAAWFAREQPYENWTVWSNAWYPVKGKPSADAVRKAFGPLLEYDGAALDKLAEYIDVSVDERLALTRRRCELTSGHCAHLGELLILDNRERDALTAYERLVAHARDRVVVSQNVTWLVRYYYDHQRVQDAEVLAQDAADVASDGGLRVQAELFDAEGRYDEAERVYRQIAQHYSGDTAALGIFLMRRALEVHDKVLEVRAADLLRHDFPNGLEPVVTYALDASPVDGAVFETFGRRAASLGFEPTDVIVAVDGWRVRNATQYYDLSRMYRGDAMTFVVWRSGQYREIKHHIPQHWVGSKYRDYSPNRAPRKP